MAENNAVCAQIECPRLQLRWVFERHCWLCRYELVLPLGEYDIRRDRDGCQNGELPLEIGYTKVHGGRMPCLAPDGTLHYDAPFRDGAHAIFDSKALGGIPIYVIAPDGTPIRNPKA